MRGGSNVIHRGPSGLALAAFSVAVGVAACGGAEHGPTGEDVVVGEEPTPIVATDPEPEGEPGGAVGGVEGGGTPCADRAQAMGERLGATAVVTGLPPHDEASEQVARVSCEENESDDACLRRAERTARAEHGRDAELDFELDGERRRVRAVVRVDGARVERTFDGTEALAAFVRAESDAGKQVSVEQMLAEIDPASRYVAVRRIRTLAPGERRGRAHLVVPGTTDDLAPRIPDIARTHDVLVEELTPMGDSLRITIECQ